MWIEQHLSAHSTIIGHLPSGADLEAGFPDYFMLFLPHPNASREKKKDGVSPLVQF